MNLQFDHKLVSSFITYLDHEILEQGNAFKNQVVTLYRDNSSKLANTTIFSSPYKQWVSDSGISGAVVPSGISGAGAFIGRGTSGLALDFNGSRAIFTGSVNLQSVSGTFSIKDINIKYTTKNEEDLLFGTKLVKNNPISPQTMTGLAERQETFPCIFVNYSPGKNVPFAMGGEDNTTVKFTAVVVADSPYLLDGTCSILRDLSKTSFALLEPSDLPFNVSGDFKSGSYNYSDVCSTKDGRDLIFINDVNAAKLSANQNSEINPDVFVALVDFDVVASRFPRS